jgi:hypothetical protein
MGDPYNFYILPSYFYDIGWYDEYKRFVRDLLQELSMYKRKIWRMWMQKVRQKTKEWPIILLGEGKRNRQIVTNQKTK